MRAAFHRQGPLGCRRDRHAAPGEGSIGAGLAAIGRHPALRGVPAILELAPEAAARGFAYLAQEGVLDPAA